MLPSALVPVAAADDVSAPRAVGMMPPVLARPPLDLTLLKRLMWLYLALWVGEGALRKWIFPGLSTPLLVVRDPVLLFMYALALAKGVFPRGMFIVWITGIGLLGLAFSLIGSKAPLFVQMYGFRADFLHLPLVFLIPNIFDRDDLRRVGLWTLIVGVPMALLVLLQFGTGAGSRFNVGAGGEGSMLDAAYGRIRPSGTFSFSNGLGDFSGLMAGFCIYGLLQPRTFPRLVWLASVPALAAMVLLSGSRGAVGLVVVVLASVFVICLFRPRYLAAAAKIVGVCVLGALTAGSVAIFRSGMDVFAYRFGDAQDVREGFVDRFFSAFVTPFELFNVVDFYGVGLGMGTNVGAGLLQGRRQFLFAEGELGRVMFESGPVVGPAFLLLRVAIALFLLSQALRTLRRDGHPLPMLLLGACSLEMVLGQFGQATTLGFATIACGLCLAANRAGASEEATEAGAATPVRAKAPPLPPPRPPRAAALPGKGSDEPATPILRPAAPAGVLPRGRSAYAERMHREAEEEGRKQKAEGRSTDAENEPPE